MEQPRQPRPRWVRALVVGLVAFEVVAGAALVARSGTERTRTAPAPPATPAPSQSHQGSADRSQALRTSAVEDLLQRRAGAIRTRDRAAFAATLDRRQAAFSKRQFAMFDNLKDVPLADWRYELDPSDTAPAPTDYATDAWAPRVTLRYRLAGFDPVPAASDQFFTFVRRGGAWLIANDADYDATGRRTARELWDFAPVVVVRGARSLVLGHPGRHALLRDVARHADAAVPRVSAVWTARWPERVVVLVPDSEAEIASMLGDVGDLSRIAAVAVAELPGGSDDRAVGNRIIVNPPNFRRLGNTGRRVVLTHEVTHVATRDASGTGLPTWLVEGFADYVGYLGTGLSARAISQELAAEVRAGRVPTALPANAEFDGANERLAQAYEAAWLAVRLVAERAGQDGVVRLYRRAGTEPLPGVLEDITGMDVPAFTAAWRDYVRRTLS
ncbi:MAG TPA: hypothetical protein VNA20_02085 [Frankiaceae bacterium]|nr:hypothetical protein [Frankiaceae bacterium]